MVISREGAKGNQNQNEINVFGPTEIYCSLVIRLGIDHWVEFIFC